MFLLGTVSVTDLLYCTSLCNISAVTTSSTTIGLSTVVSVLIVTLIITNVSLILYIIKYVNINCFILNNLLDLRDCLLSRYIRSKLSIFSDINYIVNRSNEDIPMQVCEP